MYLVVPFSPHRTTCSSALPPSWPRASVVPPKASQIRRHPLCHLAWPLGDGKDSRGLSPQRASAPVDAASQQQLLVVAGNQAAGRAGWLAGAATPARTTRAQLHMHAWANRQRITIVFCLPVVLLPCACAVHFSQWGGAMKRLV